VQSGLGSHRLARALVHSVESVLFGTYVRERLLKALLRAYYRSLFRRQWIWRIYGGPHFTLHSINLFNVLDGRSGQLIYNLYRAFLSSEIIEPGHVVLDIGCGDGALTKRFYAPRASRVDAIDVEDSAIRYARSNNAAPNIVYQRLDAVLQPFPDTQYDVIVLDGALGHFAPEAGVSLLRKISAALKPEGVFCGSESLGLEGEDHLQYFGDLDDLRSMLLHGFQVVRVRQQRYELPSGFVRREAYWRAANADVLDRWEWR
jgi:SAM-dependent methyltransferase